MAEAIKIEIFRKKDAEDFSKSLADPASRLETGGAAAMCAALSASLLARAAALTQESVKENERLDYITRNAEILRGYMVHLIDEDVKCRGPLRRALKEGDARKIDAASESAVSICAEIVCMMSSCLELAGELTALCPGSVLHYVKECAELAMAAVRSAMSYILNMSDASADETYRFVIRRENELTLQQQREIYERILAAERK